MGIAESEIGMNDTERPEPAADVVCTHCGLEGVAKEHTGISGHKLPYGWEERLVSDPIRGTELVRQWEATLCPECAAKEATTDAGPRGNERSEG